MRKRDFPVDDVRRFLEPGPIVLVSSAWKQQTNIMTMGWHMVMGEEPSLIGAFIWDQNHSFEMIRKSKECVINVPTVDIATTVVKIGNCSGRDTDKFTKFGLTAKPGKKVSAPLIEECFANFECRLVDASLIRNRYSLFVFEVVKAHVATSPWFPKNDPLPRRRPLHARRPHCLPHVSKALQTRHASGVTTRRRLFPCGTAGVVVVLFLRGLDDDEISHLPREWWLLPSIARPEFGGGGRRFA